MSVQLTPSQQAVVDNEGGSLLVSAAAGSGKTRVLVDRLFRRVLGPERANVDDFLIITYTRAAAAELRGRIAQELGERVTEMPGDRHLQRQLLLVYQADIKTIDAFCTSLLRENVHLLELEGEKGLTADFRVLDENEAMLLRRRVLPRVLEEFYADLTPGGMALADAFGFGRDDSRLEELVLDLYGKLQSHAYPEVWLAEQKALWRELPEDIADTMYGRELLAALERKAAHWQEMLDRCLEQMAGDEAIKKSYSGAFYVGRELLAALRQAIAQGWDAAAAQLPVWPRLTAVRKCENPELKERLQSVWNRCKKEMDAACAILEDPAAAVAEDLRRAAPAMEALLDLCGSFSTAYSREKLRRNATDFSDQEHYAIRLLLGEDGTPTELARTVSERYLEVMVDEYQDTNQVQNCIFSAISREGRNLFTVGDVKQSIYRFRLADPTIFLEKYHSYPDAGAEEAGKPRRILLSQNFRSRQPVLDAVNFVFRAAMSEEVGELDYTEAEQLNFGAAYLPERSDCAVEFHLLDAPMQRGEESVSRPLAEARFVAKRIRQLLDEGYPVTDPDTNALRPCRAEDIAVLLRSPGPRQRHYARAFAEQGIPCRMQESEDFFSSMEVAVTYALLQILDNPRQDVPLISVLRSPVFGFSLDRLALIRGSHPDGDLYEALAASEDDDCQAFLRQLAGLRIKAKDMSVHRLLWHLYNELNMLGIFGAMADGQRRRENLIALFEHARSFEAAGYKGLFAFVSHLRFLLENGEQPDGPASGAGGGVSLMSIHKSKGLEFPIVILADLNKTFNKMDFQTPVLVHPKLGLGPMFIDLDRHIRYPTAARRAVENRMNRELRSEEMRVLYVGMTRAKEKLIMVATLPSAEKKLGELMALSALPVPPETVAESKSMAEWILLPLLQRGEAAPLRRHGGMEAELFALTEDTPWMVFCHQSADYARPPWDAAGEEAPAPPRREMTFDPAALDYVYPHRTATLTPTKLTATQLKGREKDHQIAENTVQPYSRRAFAPPRFLSGEQPLTADQRGTATHLVMQYLPLDGDPAETVVDLVERHLLTKEQAAAVDQAAIRRFLASELAEELRRADRVEREYRFSLLVDATAYYTDMGAGEQVMLQGVVDLFAETAEGLTVVDFKTDYVTAETLEKKVADYRPQIGAYSSALEQIVEKPVIRRVLYFFRTGQTVEV